MRPVLHPSLCVFVAAAAAAAAAAGDKDKDNINNTVDALLSSAFRIATPKTVFDDTIDDDSGGGGYPTESVLRRIHNAVGYDAALHPCRRRPVDNDDSSGVCPCDPLREDAVMLKNCLLYPCDERHLLRALAAIKQREAAAAATVVHQNISSSGAAAATTSATTALNYCYDKTVAPAGALNVTSVLLLVRPLSLINVKESVQQLSMPVRVLMLWQDPRLAWSSSSSHTPHHEKEVPAAAHGRVPAVLTFHPHQIWTPELYINDRTYERFGYERDGLVAHRDVVVYQTGVAFMQATFADVLYCRFDSKTFPVDANECVLQFEVSSAVQQTLAVPYCDQKWFTKRMHDGSILTEQEALAHMPPNVRQMYELLRADICAGAVDDEVLGKTFDGIFETGEWMLAWTNVSGGGVHGSGGRRTPLFEISSQLSTRVLGARHSVIRVHFTLYRRYSIHFIIWVGVPFLVAAGCVYVSYCCCDPSERASFTSANVLSFIVLLTQLLDKLPISQDNSTPLIVQYIIGLGSIMGLSGLVSGFIAERYRVHWPLRASCFRHTSTVPTVLEPVLAAQCASAVHNIHHTTNNNVDDDEDVHRRFRGARVAPEENGVGGGGGSHALPALVRQHSLYKTALLSRCVSVEFRRKVTKRVRHLHEDAAQFMGMLCTFTAMLVFCVVFFVRWRTSITPEMAANLTDCGEQTEGYY